MRRTLTTATLLGVILTSSPVFAQSTDDDSVFDFSLPGARSRGIGGAFVAIADDATSVYSNPAGLTSLFRPEVSFEFRHWSLTNTAIDRGHAFGSPTNIGLDTLSGVHYKDFTSDLNGVSFLSFAYPRDKWAIGVFHHQLARYEMHRKTQGIFFNCVGGSRGRDAAPPYCHQSQLDGIDRLFPAVQDFDLSIRSTGFAVAVENDSDHHRLAIGATLQYFNFDLAATRLVYSAVTDLKFAAPKYEASNLELTGRRWGDDSAIAVNAGVLFDVTRELTVGATFRQGPKFNYTAETETGAMNGPAGQVFVDDLESPFQVPDTWALGLAWRPNNQWRVGFEYDKVMYSQLVEQVANTAHTATDPEGVAMSRLITVDDSDQLRFGAEYSRMAKGLLLSFRGGYWYDPLHRPYLQVDNPNTGWPAPGWALLFPKGDDEQHFTGGVGVATARRLQVDFAFDRSPSVNTYALSAIWRF